MESNFYIFEGNMILLSILIFVSLFFISLFTSIYFQKRFNLQRIKTPLVTISILVSVRIIFELNKIEWNKNKINAFIYIGIMYFAIKLLDYIILDVYVKKSKFVVPKLMHDIAVSLIYFIVFFSVLKMQLGIDLTPLLTTSAVISMVIGLALQDTLSNFIAGIVIHIERPFKYGEWVLVNGIEGKIVEINWRTVKILTFSNDFLVIPNSAVVKDSIINFNYPTPNHLHTLEIGVSYDEPPNKLKAAAKEIAMDIPYVLKQPEPIITLVKYNDFSIDYEIKLWINDFGKKKFVSDEFFTRLWYKFKRENIKIPYPIREIYTHEERKTNTKTSEFICINCEYIKAVDIFSELDHNIIEKIAQKAIKELYGKNEILFKQGDAGDSFFIIISGEVDVVINDKKTVILKNGNFFGEMSLLTGKERAATIIARTDMECLVISKQNFSEIVNLYPEVLENLSKTLVKREMENKLEADNKLKNTLSKNEKMLAEKKEKSVLKKIKDFFDV